MTTDATKPYKEQTAEAKMAELFAKVRTYYALRIAVEDNQITRDHQRGYLEHLFREEERIRQNPDTDMEKEYSKLNKLYSARLRRLDHLMKLFPSLTLLDRQQIMELNEQ